MANYLVTGGAGFIGSHCVLALLERGDNVVVIDNLSLGHRQAVLSPARLVVADLADRAAVDAVFASERFDAVVHLASLSLVGESMRVPLRYCTDNVVNALRLADAACRAGCMRFVLASTANIFGQAAKQPITEDAPETPASPYGESKLMIERGLAWAHQIHGLSYASLRFFNAAGADPGGRLGEAHDPETHLIPLAIDAALGHVPELTIFGNDYPTHDGTCIRDYVHVSDIADAVVRLVDGSDGRGLYNLGTGMGYSVSDVVAAVERVGGRRVPCKIAPRRDGDPAELIASGARLRDNTGWSPRNSELDDIVRTAYAWRQAHPHGYAGAPQPTSLVSCG